MLYASRRSQQEAQLRRPHAQKVEERIEDRVLTVNYVAKLGKPLYEFIQSKPHILSFQRAKAAVHSIFNRGNRLTDRGTATARNYP